MNYLISLFLLFASMSAAADGYGQSNSASPEEWASQYPPSNPSTDPNAPRGFNSIRGGNELYGTGANQGSGFVKDQQGRFGGNFGGNSRVAKWSCPQKITLDFISIETVQTAF